MVEVVLRNRLHASAAKHFGKGDWYQDVLKNNGNHLWQTKILTQPLLTQSFYRNGIAPYNKKTIWVGGKKKNLRHWRSPAEQKLEEIIDRLTNSGKAVTPDQVVAHAMFGFWLILFGPTFESSTDALALWPNCIGETFPYSSSMSRSSAHASLVRIKDLRNRISHHEPAWRIATPITPAAVNVALGTRIQEMKALLDATEPEIVGLLENAGTFARLRWLIDPQTIPIFAGQMNEPKVDKRSLTRKVRKLSTISQRAMCATSMPQPKKAVDLHYAGKTILTILPHA
jgi:hypothetical protein